jgi:hypothetical protein
LKKPEVKDHCMVAENLGEAVLAMLHCKGSHDPTTNSKGSTNNNDDIDDRVVLTDAQITAKSQQRAHLGEKHSKLRLQYENDMRFIM